MGSRLVLALVAALFLALPAPAAAAAPTLFHDSFDARYRTPFGAVPAGSKVTLRLRVTGAKPQSVALHLEKRFLTMRRRGTSWSATVATPRAPSIVHYDFRARIGRRTLWYGDNGDTDEVRGGTGTTTAVEQVPYTITAYDPAFRAPAWEQGALVYSIFPDRFRDGDPSNDYCRAGSTTGCPVFYGSTPARAHATWNEAVDTPPPFNRDFFGGDLEGIRAKLPYLRSLGVDAIWLNPIFKARSNHRYDTDDYMHVDPALGGDAAFEQLAIAARDQGIRLILDGVFNHASSDSLYFDRYHRYPTDGACESTSSPYRSWFKISGGTPCSSSDYTSFANVDSLPEFQHDNTGVKDFLFRANDAVAKHWLRLGAVGWRLDAAQEIDHLWWREFRSALKGEFEDAPLIGEVTATATDAGDYLLGNEFDGVMNYRFRAAALRFAAGQSLSDSNGADGAPLAPSRIDHSLKAMLEEYPRQALAASFDLIDSHDTQRALNTLAGSGSLAEARQRLRLAALLQFMWVGAPMVLYGDEVAVNAPGGDPYTRAPYPWTDESGSLGVYGPPDQQTLDNYTIYSAMRKRFPVLRSGGFSTLYTGDTTRAADDNGVYAFLRSGGADQPIAVVLNRGTTTAAVKIPLHAAFSGMSTIVDVLNGHNVSVTGGAANVTLPPLSAVVLGPPVAP
jgi:glycosidase